MRAMTDAITSLRNRFKVRVTLGGNGENIRPRHRRRHHADGAAIFETTGAWEGLLDAARDFRL